jgi:hypothetical protein
MGNGRDESLVAAIPMDASVTEMPPFLAGLRDRDARKTKSPLNE